MPRQNSKYLLAGIISLIAGIIMMLRTASAADTTGVLNNFGWREFNELVAMVGTTAVLIWTPLWVWLKYKLSNEFASKNDVQNLGGRLSSLEHELRRLPDAQDMEEISKRVGKVERGVAVAVEQTKGVRDLLTRVERNLGLIMENQLSKDK